MDCSLAYQFAHDSNIPLAASYPDSVVAHASYVRRYISFMTGVIHLPDIPSLALIDTFDGINLNDTYEGVKIRTSLMKCVANGRESCDTDPEVKNSKKEKKRTRKQGFQPKKGHVKPKKEKKRTRKQGFQPKKGHVSRSQVRIPRFHNSSTSSSPLSSVSPSRLPPSARLFASKNINL